MKKLALPTKSHVIGFVGRPELDEQMIHVGDRFGFVYDNSGSKKEFQDTCRKTKEVVAVLINNDDRELASVESLDQEKIILVTPEDSVASILDRFDQQLSKNIPLKLIELVESSLKVIIPTVLKTNLDNLHRNLEFVPDFTDWVTCDSIADGYAAKAFCEVSFSKVRKQYPTLAQKSDSQLQDAFGELCNQILGTMNSQLRLIGLNPLISLPVATKLAENGEVSQSGFLPSVRFTDSVNSVAIGVGIHVDLTPPKPWDKVSSDLKGSEVEFL